MHVEQGHLYFYLIHYIPIEFTEKEMYPLMQKNFKNFHLGPFTLL